MEEMWSFIRSFITQELGYTKLFFNKLNDVQNPANNSKNSKRTAPKHVFEYVLFNRSTMHVVPR